MSAQFVGREEEARILEKCYSSEKSELVAVYGRRRVGKTYLIRSVLGDRFDFDFTGMYDTPASEQRKQFCKALKDKTGKREKTASDWYEAFDRLRDYLLSLQKETVAVFLDELPWMDTPRSHFLSALSRFWNDWGRERVKLKLYVCGSATTWMVDKLIGDRGGLYGRTTRSIYLSPFSLRETEQFLNEIRQMDYGRMQVLDVYMILGGIPYYLDMLDGDLPFSVNIDRLFFSENAPLKTEYEFLFRSLFKESDHYRRVVEALSSKLKGMTREEIIESTRLEGGELSLILRNLNSCDFIRTYTEPGKTERGKMYQLTDLFSLFYLRFVKNHDGQDRRYWSNLSQHGTKNAWAGYAFEQVCLHHIAQIKQALGISGILSNVYAWSSRAFVSSDGSEWKGGQIDLIIDRSDKVMNLCEMKYSLDMYEITKDYETTVRERISSFRKKAKTNKNLRCTFVTTYGIKKNRHSGIVDHQVILDDLFRSAD
ncbi:MAG: AAA family ATPase [Clostridia bacterium]|nr:AAA family ATPase [Clostridia bacterium]